MTLVSSTRSAGSTKPWSFGAAAGWPPPVTAAAAACGVYVGRSSKRSTSTGAFAAPGFAGAPAAGAFSFAASRIRTRVPLGSLPASGSPSRGAEDALPRVLEVARGDRLAVRPHRLRPQVEAEDAVVVALLPVRGDALR